VTDGYRIRAATSEDADQLVAFTLREAQDAEGVTLNADGVARGVASALENPSLARYWVAETPDGRVVASISVTTEWSNFYGGHYWWVQSLFVAAEHRGRGLADLLLDYLARAAASAGALDLRLYAHEDNARARRVYDRCGFTRARYLLMRRSVTTARGTSATRES
jgi:GNAT superfamily N-acetyltransferase